MKIPQKLSGKVCVVIGGTSGLGEAIALALAREGALVIPASRRRPRVARTLRRLEKEVHNLWKEALTVDVKDEQDVKRLTSLVLKRVGHVDGVVCTAGAHLKRPFLETTTRQWRDILEVNLMGTYFVNKHFGAIMIRRGKGSLINVSSLGAKEALSKASAYCVSKAGVSMLTKSLAVEWASKGVRVNAIVPGVFPTPLNQKALQEKKRKLRILARTPLGRFGSVSEIAGAAVYLVSDESSFVTGTELVVDGGFLASSGF